MRCALGSYRAFAQPISNEPDHHCPQHGLAKAPDGQCVLCKREGVIDLPADPPSALHLVSFLAWPVVFIGVAAWMFDVGHRGSASSPVPIGLPPITVQARLEPDPLTLEPPIKTPEEQVADAERARLLREQQPEDSERSSPQPAQAADTTRRDQEARDSARHDAVKRELAAMSVQGARRDVVSRCILPRGAAYARWLATTCAKRASPSTSTTWRRDDAARTQARALNPRARSTATS